jgi:nicotinamide-nucleotide amidase
MVRLPDMAPGRFALILARGSEEQEMAFSKRLAELAGHAMDAAKARGWSVVTAESCTAGKLAAVLSETPGASDYLHGGFVAYTKHNKTRALGVPAELIKQKGAVCSDVAIAMADGALRHSPADIAVAITGVAGPEPDEDGNPVGLVCIAVVARGANKPIHVEKRYGEIDHDAIQDRAMADALTELIRAIAEG